MALVAFASCGSDEEDELIGNWYSRGDFNGPARGYATSFVIGDNAYVCLGYNAKSKAMNDIWVYDAVKKTWDSLAMFPGVARYGASAFVVNSKAYVGLGTNGTECYKDFWEFDPTKGPIDPKTKNPKGEWTRVTEDFLGASRCLAVAEGLAGKGIVGTGVDAISQGSNLKDFFSFTPGSTPGSGTWVEISSYEGEKRQAASTFVIGNYMYLVGGINNNRNPVDMQKYDPSSNKWEKVLDLRNTDLTSDDDKYGSIPRANASTFVINGKGYITLGTIGSSQTYTTFEYDPSANKWIEVTAFSKAWRSNAVSFSLSETGKTRGFVLTGKSGDTRFDDFCEFYPNVENDTYDD